MRTIRKLAAPLLLLTAFFMSPAQPLGRDRPLSVEEITKLASSGVPESRLIDIIHELGIGFTPTYHALDELRKGGVTDVVLQEIQKQVPKGSNSSTSGKNPLAGGAGNSTNADPVRNTTNPLAGGSTSAEPDDEDYGDDFAASIPGVDMSGLSGAAKRRVLARLGSEACPCGCKFNVAECRVKDPACQVSLGLANKAVQEVAASMPASAGRSASSQTSTGIFVNERELTPQQVQQIKSLYMFVAPPGHYWYDSRSGLWGMMGHESAGFLRPGHDFGQMPANPSNGNTGVFINGREINLAEAMYCQQMFGAVYRGHWWLDGATGNLGMEGNPTPLANVYMLMQQRQRAAGSGGGGKGYSWSSKVTGAYGGSDGSCSYVSIPGSGSVMTGNCD
jgi:hypothetical protein